MPAPAPRRDAHDAPVPRASSIERAVTIRRAKRRARVEHELERKRARRRFFALLVALLFFTAFLSLSIWDQIQALFGL
jgi:hypothetical protein